jgi:hypothetical protein
VNICQGSWRLLAHQGLLNLVTTNSIQDRKDLLSQVRLPFTFLQVELIFTIITTILYLIAFIVILSGFGWCAGNSECDARIAAGVRPQIPDTIMQLLSFF